VTADAVVVATHGAALYSTSEDCTLSDRLHPRATFAVAGVVARGLLPEGLYWEWTDGPYEYLRVDRGDEQDQVVLGGFDRPVSSTEDAEAAILDALERRCEERLRGVRVSKRWAGRVLETEDGLPYIGEYSRNRFIATGFSGNGLTFGTLGGIMAADAFTGRDNPWREVFDPRRVARAGAADHRGEEATAVSRAVCGLSG
jgi:glycine/D-amino acid oxidase-like deaminating enzyme